jgi:NADH:ubiquinone oxidoreductase subunit B-like Fe-S oxidoreductase
MSRKTGRLKEEEERYNKFIAALKSFWDKGVAVLMSAGLEEEASHEVLSILAFTMFECGITLQETKNVLNHTRRYGELKMTIKKIDELIVVLGEIRETAISFNS